MLPIRHRTEPRRVLVTGAAQGIGRRTAELLLERGAHVAMLDRDEQAVTLAAEALGPRALGLHADVTDSDAVARATDEAAHVFGGLDVVVANAGIAPRMAATVASAAPDELERVMAVNVTGVWHTVRAGLAHLERGGRVAIVASVYAYANGAFMAPYAASKAAVESLGRSLRVELGSRGIGVTIAYFGPVDTAFVHAFDGDTTATTVQKAFPAPLVHRIKPDQAAAECVKAIERGRPRVITPRRWIALEHLRGPIARVGDALLVRNRALGAVAAAVERDAAPAP